MNTFENDVERPSEEAEISRDEILKHCSRITESKMMDGRLGDMHIICNRGALRQKELRKETIRYVCSLIPPEDELAVRKAYLWKNTGIEMRKVTYGLADDTVKDQYCGFPPSHNSSS